MRLQPRSTSARATRARTARDTRCRAPRADRTRCRSRWPARAPAAPALRNAPSVPSRIERSRRSCTWRASSSMRSNSLASSDIAAMPSTGPTMSGADRAAILEPALGERARLADDARVVRHARHHRQQLRPHRRHLRILALLRRPADGARARTEQLGDRAPNAAYSRSSSSRGLSRNKRPTPWLKTRRSSSPRNAGNSASASPSGSVALLHLGRDVRRQMRALARPSAPSRTPASAPPATPRRSARGSSRPRRRWPAATSDTPAAPPPSSPCRAACSSRRPATSSTPAPSTAAPTADRRR